MVYRIHLARVALLLVAIQALASCQECNAHEGEHRHEKRKYLEADEYLPSPRPDRVCLTWSGDPRHCISISWRTDTSVSETIVESAPAETLRGNLRSGDVPHADEEEGEHVPFTSDGGNCHMHTVELDELEPSTMYAYRVGDGTYWSEWFQFRTAADGADEFTFVYFGDAQDAVRSMWSRVIRKANQHAPRASFMLHAGDLVNSSNVDIEWGEWFEAGGWLNGMIPVVATPGNHEYRDGRLSRHWRPQFAFPKNGPKGLEDTVYFIDFQGARIVSLNSNEDVDRQVVWLHDVLNDEHRPKWTFITFHHPIFSAARDRDNPELRAALQPIFERYRVDLVLQGHDHAYNRSGLGGPANADNVPVGVRQRDSNTVYVVSVSGPKMYRLQEEWDVPRVASGVQLFQVIRVTPQTVYFEARTAEGELYDAFTLTKSDDGSSSVFEHLPNVEEIRQ